MHIKILSSIFDAINLKNNDIILAAYPKTGSTWLRFMFCNPISIKEWDGRDIDFNILNKTMVSFGDGNLVKKWNHTFPRIIKTHMKYKPIFRKNYTILMIRDPRDVMISYYHYLKAKKNPVFHFKDVKTKKEYKDTFTNFIEHNKCGFENFFHHYNSWKNSADIIIKYEDLKKQPIDEVNKILEKIGIDNSNQ